MKFNPKWYRGGGGGGGGIHPLEVFPPLCQNVWNQGAETFLLLILTYGPLFAVAFINPKQARVHNLVDRSYKNFKTFILPIVSIVFYCFSLSVFCSNFETLLEVQDVH